MSENDSMNSSHNTTRDSAEQNSSSGIKESPPPIEASAPRKTTLQKEINAESSAESSADEASIATLDKPVGEATLDELLADSKNDSLAADKSEAGKSEAGEEAINDNESALGIDHRRAKQLLDRAMLLSERGDLAGAILASRQAVALAPNEPSGHSMLGLLQERSGDLERAINSYEKVLQLAPHSSLERDSLERLKSTLESENSSVLFHFDDNELFEEPVPIAPPVESPVQETATNAIAKPAAAAATMAATVAASTNTNVVGAKPVVTPASKPASKIEAVNEGAKPAPFDSQTFLPPAKIPAGRPSFTPYASSATARQPSLGLLMRKPSFYFKGAPIVAATTLGLLFMAWAEGVSQRKYLDETLPGSTPNAVIMSRPNEGDNQGGSATQAGSIEGGPVAPPQNGNVNGGGIFGQGQTSGSPPTTSVPAPGAPAARAGSSGVVTSGSPSSGGSVAAPSASGGGRVLPPAIPQPNGINGVANGARTNNGAGNSGSASGSSTLDTLPVLQPRVTRSETVRPSAPTAPQSAAPAVSSSDNSGANTSGTSSQGGPFNPSNAPRGYIRVDPVRPINPVTPVARPANEARAAENAASRAAASGRTNDVVPSLNRAIERQATGYTYQRRAMAWMEQGDFSRAADDFQSAIAGYEDQIRRGQNVEDARNGISTCRSGLNLALSRMGR